MGNKKTYASTARQSLFMDRVEIQIPHNVKIIKLFVIKKI